MPFLPGDLVHVASLGKGTVREVRNGGRYLVDVHGRSLVATADQLSAREESPRKGSRARVVTRRAPQEFSAASSPSDSLDLHGKTVDEALEAAIGFLDRALLAGSAEVRIIHGRSGGRIKAALHAQLKEMSSVRAFRLDPKNPGVTIVDL